MASTSSLSWRTTVGTMALRDTAYALPIASTANASGKSRRLWRSSIITKQASERAPPSTPMSIQRRPPTARSSTGPMNGATSAKGAIVSAR